MSCRRRSKTIYVLLGGTYRFESLGFAWDNSQPARLNWLDDMPFVGISFCHLRNGYDEWNRRVPKSGPQPQSQTTGTLIVGGRCYDDIEVVTGEVPRCSENKFWDYLSWNSLSEEALGFSSGLNPPETWYLMPSLRRPLTNLVAFTAWSGIQPLKDLAWWQGSSGVIIICKQ